MITDKYQEWRRRATETAKNLGDNTDQYIRENTWSTIALAAIAGCLLGFLLTNRRG